MSTIFSFGRHNCVLCYFVYNTFYVCMYVFILPDYSSIDYTTSMNKDYDNLFRPNCIHHVVHCLIDLNKQNYLSIIYLTYVFYSSQHNIPY